MSICCKCSVPNCTKSFQRNQANNFNLTQNQCNQVCVSGCEFECMQNVIRSSKETKQCTLIKFGNVSSSDTQTSSINLKCTHAQSPERDTNSTHFGTESLENAKLSRKITEKFNQKMNCLSSWKRIYCAKYFICFLFFGFPKCREPFICPTLQTFELFKFSDAYELENCVLKK